MLYVQSYTPFPKGYIRIGDEAFQRHYEELNRCIRYKRARRPCLRKLWIKPATEEEDRSRCDGTRTIMSTPNYAIDELEATTLLNGYTIEFQKKEHDLGNGYSETYQYVYTFIERKDGGFDHAFYELSTGACAFLDDNYLHFSRGYVCIKQSSDKWDYFPIFKEITINTQDCRYYQNNGYSYRPYRPPLYFNQIVYLNEPLGQLCTLTRGNRGIRYPSPEFANMDFHDMRNPKKPVQWEHRQFADYELRLMIGWWDEE